MRATKFVAVTLVQIALLLGCCLARLPILFGAEEAPEKPQSSQLPGKRKHRGWYSTLCGRREVGSKGEEGGSILALLAVKSAVRPRYQENSGTLSETPTISTQCPDQYYD